MEKKSANVAAEAAKRRRKQEAKRQYQGNSNDPTAKLNLRVLVAKLPCGKAEKDVERRSTLFNSFDVSSSKTLSLNEVNSGMRALLAGTLGASAFDALSPAISRAFHAAKDANAGPGGGAKGKGDGKGDDGQSVSKSEFRLLLVYLKKYTELLQVFDTIDTSDDRRVDLPEFEASLPLLEQWGVAIADPAAEFRAIDDNGGGAVLFDEFAGWALQRGLDMDARDDVDGEESLLQHHKMLWASHPPPLGKSPRSSPRWRFPASADLPTLVNALPCGRDERERLGRRDLFAAIDPAGCNALTLDSLEFGLRRALGDSAQRARGSLANCIAPALARAFQAVGDAKNVDYIGRSEFRLLLVYFKWYFQEYAVSASSPHVSWLKLPKKPRSPYSSPVRSPVSSPMTITSRLLVLPQDPTEMRFEVRLPPINSAR